EEHQLGEGGCGAVFSGYRIEDRFPVSVQMMVVRQAVTQIMDNIMLSVEVAIMVKLAGEAEGSVGISAPVSLLEWFDLGKELILVALDCTAFNQGRKALTHYCVFHLFQVILKQLVDAVKELEDKHIFHRDIKGENILIETGSDVPRVRIIDFGLSCFVKQRSLYRVFYGTPLHTPPEWYRRSCYRCGPTTVWQMGVVLYEATIIFIFLIFSFFQECQNFLEACLTIAPEKRPTLEELQTLTDSSSLHSSCLISKHQDGSRENTHLESSWDYGEISYASYDAVPDFKAV
uniref:non-specific serine/threonine protein kinase n=1 Tax=Maylandia zebra TaxID=106582 RepID=A0A3P9CPX3_9CICH